MPNSHFIIKFWECRKTVSILSHEAKALLELFCLQPIVISERQNSWSSSFASWSIIKIHDFPLADQDWIRLMFFKNFADRDWTWTEKFHSPLISGAHYRNGVCTWPTLEGAKHVILTTAVSSFARAQKMDNHTVAHWRSKAKYHPGPTMKVLSTTQIRLKNF